MFVAIFIILAGIALYFLLKPSTAMEYEQALSIKPISELELEVKEQRSKPTVNKLGKAYN